MSAQLDYWHEVLAQSCDEHGATLTNDQLKAIADDLRISHENYGMAFYQPPAEPRRDIDALKKELDEERSLVFCRSCQGRGRLITHCGTFQSESDCHECNGRGKHK